ncbi:MAG: DUF554 domain-containing protein [Clostridia bacterium]|nr:DUF554 domain-containing protein [Clostridia bacterium]
MLGVIVNGALVVAGGLIGLLLKKGLPERISELLISGMGLVVIYIGLDGAMAGTNALIAVISMAVGGVIGGLLDLDGAINKGAKKLEDRFKKDGFAKGFSTATLVFVVGAMAIVGSLKAGLGDNSTLFTKGVIDGVTAIVFASTLGFGVLFSAVPVVLYQGAIALVSGFAAPYLTDYVIGEVSCVGSILIMAIGLNLLGLTKIKVMNLMPAMFVPILLCSFM